LAKSSKFNASDYPWFKREDYAPQREFIELTDWAWMLGVRLVLSDVDLTVMPPERKETFWHDFQHRVCPKTYLEKKRRGEIPPRSFVPHPAVRDVTYEIQGPGVKKIENALEFGRRLLLIDPWASDESLKTHFDQYLRLLRNEVPVPFKRSGRPGSNSGITPLYFNRWAEHSILAVFDLNFYTRIFRKPRLTREALYESIIAPVNEGDGDSTTDPEEWGKKAKRLLKEAIDGIPFLVVQAGSGAK